MKVVTIVGARPQFIKASPLCKALKKNHINEFLVDTGQHYDTSMAGSFFEELGLPDPAYSLKVGSGPHGQMTGRMLEKIELVLDEVKPDATIVYGDTNSTIAGALASAKMAIPVVHIEAGLRSFRKTMPEEINRCMTDHISRLLLCPTSLAVKNLIDEGVAPQDTSVTRATAAEIIGLEPSNGPVVLNVGDIMVDALAQAQQKKVKPYFINDLDGKEFILVTIHRAESTDNIKVFKNLIRRIADLGKKTNVLFPLHPRTKNKMAELDLFSYFEDTSVACLEPLSYGEFTQAQAMAKVIITDSGGVQKEAFILGTPCLTLREETEWMETVESGWNRLLGVAPKDLISEVENVSRPETSISEVYGDGKTAERIAIAIQNIFSR